MRRNSQRSQFNYYNLEVYFSIANLYRTILICIPEIMSMDLDLAAADKVKTVDPEDCS